MLEWTCQARDYGYAFYGRPIRKDDAYADDTRHLRFKIRFFTLSSQCQLLVIFDDHWHSTRSISFEFAQLSEAWDFAAAILKHLPAHPQEYLQIGRSA